MIGGLFHTAVIQGGTWDKLSPSTINPSIHQHPFPHSAPPSGSEGFPRADGICTVWLHSVLFKKRYLQHSQRLLLELWSAEVTPTIGHPIVPSAVCFQSTLADMLVKLLHFLTF